MSEFNEFEPRLKSDKNRFQLSADLNLEKLNAIEPTIFEPRLDVKLRLKFFKFGLRLPELFCKLHKLPEAVLSLSSSSIGQSSSRSLTIHQSIYKDTFLHHCRTSFNTYILNYSLIWVISG